MQTTNKSGVFIIKEKYRITGTKEKRKILLTNKSISNLLYNLLILIIVKNPIINEIIFKTYTAYNGFELKNKNGTINQERRGLQYPFTASETSPLAYAWDI